MIRMAQPEGASLLLGPAAPANHADPYHDQDEWPEPAKRIIYDAEVFQQEKGSCDDQNGRPYIVHTATAFVFPPLVFMFLRLVFVLFFRISLVFHEDPSRISTLDAAVSIVTVI